MQNVRRIGMHVGLTCIVYSLGVTTWNGNPLHTGYELKVGGKEVELSCQVTASQLPDMSGEKGIAAGEVGRYTPPPEFMGPPHDVGYVEGLSASVGKFVPPTSFYGVPAKSKPKGPMYVAFLTYLRRC
jgi:hypothetical protein